MTSLSEPISPELVLVSPELAAIARAELPDRPWEMFLPLADSIAVLRAPAAARPPAQVADDEHDAPQAQSRSRPRVPVGLILMLGFVGLITAGSVLPTRNAPTLGPPPARAGTTVTTPPPPPLPAPSPPTSRSRDRNRELAPRVKISRSRDRNREPAPRVKIVRRRQIVRPAVAHRPAGRSAKAAARLRMRASHAYILTNGKGFVRVGPRGQSILELHVVLPCAGTVVVRGLAVDAHGRFRARRRVGPGARVPVGLLGIVDAPKAVHGVIRVTGGKCRGVALGFVARRS